MSNHNRKRASSQRGATLIVSLVILAVITILGIASIRNSSLELKMAASARDRAVAFQRAEAALTRVEETLSAEPPPFGVSSFLSTCSGNNCFKADCSNGLCFAGDFDNATSTTQCKTVKAGQDQREFWKEPSVWNTAGKHRTASVGKTKDSATAEDVKYIIEFMCFVPRTAQVISSTHKEGDTDVPLYRITVQAQGEASRSTVMLQSTFRVSQ